MERVESLIADIHALNPPASSGLMRFIALVRHDALRTGRLIGNFGVELHATGGTALVDRFFRSTEMSITKSWVWNVRIFVQEALAAKCDLQGSAAAHGCTEDVAQEIDAVVRRTTG